MPLLTQVAKGGLSLDVADGRFSEPPIEWGETTSAITSHGDAFARRFIPLQTGRSVVPKEVNACLIRVWFVR